VNSYNMLLFRGTMERKNRKNAIIQLLFFKKKSIKKKARDKLSKVLIFAACYNVSTL